MSRDATCCTEPVDVTSGEMEILMKTLMAKHIEENNSVAFMKERDIRIPTVFVM